MKVKKYTKKPVTVEAIQFDGRNFTEIELFVGQRLDKSAPPVHMEYDQEIPASAYNIIIPTLEGNLKATKGDFIIKGIRGECYPCKPDVFEETYSEV